MTRIIGQQELEALFVRIGKLKFNACRNRYFWEKLGDKEPYRGY